MLAALNRCAGSAQSSHTLKQTMNPSLDEARGLQLRN